MRSQDSQADVWKASCPPGALHHSPGASPAASLPCSRGMKVPAAAAPRTDEVPGRLAPPRDASVGGCPTSSSRAGSSLFRGVLCQMPRDAAPVARGQPGCVCSTTPLPHSPLVSPSLSSLQSNLLNSPCPRARSVHFHDVSSLCPRATHRGSPPLRRSRGGSCLCHESRGQGRLLTSGFCNTRAGSVSHRGLITWKVCQERRELGFREMLGTLKQRGQGDGWRSRHLWGKWEWRC